MLKRKSNEEQKLPSKLKQNHDKETFTIKIGLNNVVKNTILKNQIQIDVEEMSRLCYEVSLYIYHDIMEKLEDTVEYIFEPIRFLDYFYCLVNNKQHSTTHSYSVLRSRFNLREYDKSYKSNLMVSASRAYETVFENNIWMHGWHRVKRFLSRTNENASKTDLYNSTQFLFSTDQQYNIGKTITSIPQYWTRHFANLEKKNKSCTPELEISTTFGQQIKQMDGKTLNLFLYSNWADSMSIMIRMLSINCCRHVI